MENPAHFCVEINSDAGLLLFTQFSNAATDAAIVLRGEYVKPRVIGAMVLVLLSIFVVAGAGFEPAAFRL